MITSHVEFGANWSTSKTLFERDWQIVSASQSLKKWLSAHYAVTSISADMVSESQLRVRVAFKPVSSPIQQRNRAFAIDGFIGGFLAGLEDHQ